MGAFINATVIAALIAGAIAVFGYLLNQHNQRRERRAGMFADALRSVRTYQELPYEVWRRDDDELATRVRLREAAGRAYHDIYYHLHRLQIEAPAAGAAYALLFEQTRRQDRLNRPIAWGSRIGDPEYRLWELPKFHGDNGPETDLCIEAMRTELSLLGAVRRRSLRRRVHELESKRVIRTEALDA